jgi:hypothetical protein
MSEFMHLYFSTSPYEDTLISSLITLAFMVSMLVSLNKIPATVISAQDLQ